jgi:hypothetical protein
VTVFDDLVGQEAAVEVLARAARAAADRLAGGSGDGMTHAWLLTGPPGSGRSTAARAFAAALLCERGGCGQCPACHTARTGTSADVDVVATSQLSIGVDAARALVARAARTPIGGRWQVVVIEDADRLTDSAANALLKAIEEPTPRTVWVLCAPGLEDVLPTVGRAAATSGCERLPHAQWPTCSSGATASTARWPPSRRGLRRDTSVVPVGWPPTSRPDCAATRRSCCRKRYAPCPRPSPQPPDSSRPRPTTRRP